VEDIGVYTVGRWLYGMGDSCELVAGVVSGRCDPVRSTYLSFLVFETFTHEDVSRQSVGNGRSDVHSAPVVLLHRPQL